MWLGTGNGSTWFEVRERLRFLGKCWWSKHSVPHASSHLAFSPSNYDHHLSVNLDRSITNVNKAINSSRELMCYCKENNRNVFIYLWCDIVLEIQVSSLLHEHSAARLCISVSAAIHSAVFWARNSSCPLKLCFCGRPWEAGLKDQHTLQPVGDLRLGGWTMLLLAHII